MSDCHAIVISDFFSIKNDVEHIVKQFNYYISCLQSFN